MQGSAQWHAERDSRVVRGSEASLCLNLMPDSQAHYEQRRTPIPAYLADHGKAREPEALQYVRCLLPDECVWTCGFCPLPEDPERVGASPDALTLNAVVEIKAPYHLRYDTAYCWPCIPVERVVQLELEMRCTRRTHTYYVLYFRRGVCWCFCMSATTRCGASLLRRGCACSSRRAQPAGRGTRSAPSRARGRCAGVWQRRTRARRISSTPATTWIRRQLVHGQRASPTRWRGLFLLAMKHLTRAHERRKKHVARTRKQPIHAALACRVQVRDRKLVAGAYGQVNSVRHSMPRYRL